MLEFRALRQRGFVHFVGDAVLFSDEEAFCDVRLVSEDIAGFELQLFNTVADKDLEAGIFIDRECGRKRLRDEDQLVTDHALDIPRAVSRFVRQTAIYGRILLKGDGFVPHHRDAFLGHRERSRIFARPVKLHLPAFRIANGWNVIRIGHDLTEIGWFIDDGQGFGFRFGVSAIDRIGVLPAWTASCECKAYDENRCCRSDHHALPIAPIW